MMSNNIFDMGVGCPMNVFKELNPYNVFAMYFTILDLSDAIIRQEQTLYAIQIAQHFSR